MRRTERVVAALIFAVALAGGALIPRLLSVPALSLGVPLGLGPSSVGVQVLAIPRARRQATHPQGAPASAKAAPAASAAPVAPVVAQPAPSAVPAPKPRQHRPPSPPPPSPPPPPPPPPALVRQVTANEASSSTLAVPVEGGTTTGDGLVAAIALKAGSSASVNSVQDSSGGGWVRGAVGYLTGSNSRIELWYRLAAPDVTSVTVALSRGRSASAEVTEWSGLVTTPVDTAGGGSDESAASVSTPLITTGGAGDLVISAINYPNNVSSSLAAGPFNALTDFGYSTTIHGRIAYALTTASTTGRAAWTLSGESGGAGGAILAFNAASH